MGTIHESAAAAEVIVPLAFPFRHGGYDHVLLARVDHACLVERIATHPESRGSIHYEVIVVQVERARRWPDGHVTPAHERYPKPALWGTAAWTYRTHAAAERVFAALAAEQDFLPAGGVNRVPPSRTLGSARREAARADAVSKSGHSRRHPDPAPRPVRADALLGLVRRPVATIADCPLGATVQLASGAWVQVVERNRCVVTIADPDRGRREVAPATEVFAQRPMLVAAPEVPGA
jgi:hypothetical protein